MAMTDAQTSGAEAALPRAFFLAHGSPMNAIEDNAYTAFLARLGASLPRPKALVVFSSHWATRGFRVTAAARPPQLYDFGGFPPELYALRYAPPGDPELAGRIAALAELELDERRGIDHAAWALACRLFPDAELPLLEISWDQAGQPGSHVDLGRRLAGLAAEGVLFVGSGNVVHNLRELSWDAGAPVFPWAAKADAWFKDKIEAADIEALAEYRSALPAWQGAVPTPDHLMPLLAVMGLRRPGSAVETLHEEIQNGSISMRSFAVRAG